MGVLGIIGTIYAVLFLIALVVSEIDEKILLPRRIRRQSTEYDKDRLRKAIRGIESGFKHL